MAEGITWVTNDPERAKKPVQPSDHPPQKVINSRVEAWRTEISENYQIMKVFNDMDPSDVFRMLSQFSARASEIRSIIGEQESRKEASFRIRVIDPFIEECDRQFKIHSRTLATDEMNARLAGGRFT